MVRRGASVELLRLFLALHPAAASPAATAAWPVSGDALVLVQRALLQQEALQAPAQEPRNASSPEPAPSFPPGTEAEVAVSAGSGGVAFQRCTVVGSGAAPNSHDIYLLDVAPAYRSVSSVPQELLRIRGSKDRPSAELAMLLVGEGPDDRRDVVDKAVKLLSRSAKAPADPAKAAELEAALTHEAAKTEALKARLKSEQAGESFDAFDRNGDGIVTRDEFKAGEAGSKKRRLLPKFVRGALSKLWRGKPPELAKASEPAEQAKNSTPQVSESAEQAANSTEASPPTSPEASESATQDANSTGSPSPPLVRPRAKVDPGQKVKVWERRAKDWEGECLMEERPRLLEVLETLRVEKAEAVLARLPASCSGQELGRGGRGFAYEELTECVRNLTKTSWACSVCPVKFMISLGANCQRRCAALVQGRNRGNDCMECVRQPALRLLRCAGVPGIADIERRLHGFRLHNRTAALFNGGLAEFVGGQQALNRLQRQAWAVQRLILAWGLDPTGLDLLAAPLLKAMGVKSEDELDAPVPAKLPRDDGSSALIAPSDVTRYDADGSGSLDSEELSRALAGVGVTEGKNGSSNGTAAASRGQRQSDHSAERFFESSSSNTTAIATVLVRKNVTVQPRERKNFTAKPRENTTVLSREAQRRADEEKRRKLQEERRRQAEEHEKRKAEQKKALEESRLKAEEDAKRKAEERIKQRAKALADRDEQLAAVKRAREEERKKIQDDIQQEREEAEDRRRQFEAREKADEEAKMKEEEDKKKKVQEAEQKAEEEERRRIEQDPKLRAQEAEWREALASEDEKAETQEGLMAGKAIAEDRTERKANEETKRMEEATSRADGGLRQKAEEEAKSRAAEEAARRKAAEEAKKSAEAAAKKIAEGEEAKSRAAEEEARRKAAEEAKKSAEAAAKKKAEEEEAKSRAAEEEARRKAAEEAKKSSEAAAKKKAEEEEAKSRAAEKAAQQNAAEEAKMSAEAAAKRKAEEEEEAKSRAAEEAARRKAAEEALKEKVKSNEVSAQPEKEESMQTEEATKLHAEEKAMTRIKETAKQEAVEEAKRKTEEAKRKAEEQAKAEQEAKMQAENEVKQKAKDAVPEAVTATGTKSMDEAAQSTADSTEESEDDLS